MIRIPTTLALLALSLVPAAAQEAAPTPTQPAAADIAIDPAANVAQPKQADLLTGLYATRAVIEICSVAVEPAVTDAMAADEERLAAALRLDAAASEEGYATVKASVERTAPDCAEGSADRAGVDAVTSIYATEVARGPAAPAAAAPAAGSATPAASAAPAPAAP